MYFVEREMKVYKNQTFSIYSAYIKCHIVIIYCLFLSKRVNVCKKNIVTLYIINSFEIIGSDIPFIFCNYIQTYIYVIRNNNNN